MRVDVVWLSVALLSFPLFTQCLQPLNIMVAPNLLRVGTIVKVFVEIQDHTGGDVTVNIRVRTFPHSIQELASTEVTLTAANKYQALAEIMIPERDLYFISDTEKQYVYLQTKFPNELLEKVVMLSFQSGFIFIQTDKSIYRPESTVYYNLIAVNPDLQPVDKRKVNCEIINPNGISVLAEFFEIKKGIITGRYVLPEISSPGLWTIAAHYNETPQKKFSAQFEVKEYVLPNFEVTLKPSKAFFCVDDQELQVHITVKSLFGKKVDGVAFISFGVEKNQMKIKLPAALSRIEIVDGEGQVTFKGEMIRSTINNVNELVGGSLYVSAQILSNAASGIVEDHTMNIPIVQSPYTIHFKKTTQYFKPGMPFDVMVFVTNPDETPAENVDVILSSRSGDSVKGRTKVNGMAKLTMNTQLGTNNLPVTVKTADPTIAPKQQAVNTMTAKAYETNGPSIYLHISIDAPELQIGDHVKVNVLFSKSTTQNKDFTYMILNKGQIVMAKRFEIQGQSLVSFDLPITKELMPSFRLVAYYRVEDSKVVSDSVWVDVKDTCIGSLKLTTKTDPKTLQPGDLLTLIVTGDPSAKVGLVAVDKGVFVLNKSRLTQSKMWDIVEKHDIGCTAGGGKDSMGVFYDAGLIFQSSRAGGTIVRSARRRRDESVPPITQEQRKNPEFVSNSTGFTPSSSGSAFNSFFSKSAGKYNNNLQKCCSNGLRRNEMGYTCEERAINITGDEECAKAFLLCCKEIEMNQQREIGGLKPYRTRRSHNDDEFINSDDIFTRVIFPESHMMQHIELPKCAKSQCETTSWEIRANSLEDSITTWQVLATSLSKTHGLCVADPLELTFVKDFFVDLKLPYSVIRNQQVEIKAVIHNNSKKNQKVRVEFFETDKICSLASKNIQYRVITNVESFSTKVVPFMIIPLETGEYTTDVQVSTDTDSDGVRRNLKVLCEGVLTEKVELDTLLNPSQQPGGVQILQVRSPMPVDHVPGCQVNNYITVAGDKMSQEIEEVISGDFMGRLFVLASGSGEQNIFFMTLPVIATHYLDITNQWNQVGAQRRHEAVQQIQGGYERQLYYQKDDGSYAPWVTHPSSTWLTAYVAKVFTLASDIINIREEKICNAVEWLTVFAQNSNGSFTEPSPVIYHQEMLGDKLRKDGDASFTAFVLTSMQEASEHYKPSDSNVPNSMKKAVDYLERRLPTLTNPYAVALTFYALANAGKGNKEILLKFSSEDGNGIYWKSEGEFHSLEATAYAILALVKMEDLSNAGKAVKWLNKQGRPYGDYGTSHATIMVFQALAEYYTKVRKEMEERVLEVELVLPSSVRPIKWIFGKKNLPLKRSLKAHMQDVPVTAKGTGTANIKVVTRYYAKPSENPDKCKTFSLSVDMQREASAVGVEVYMLTIEYLYKNPDRDATMSILDISMLTGFNIDDADLKQLSISKGTTFEKSKKMLMQQGSLTFYLNKVSRNKPEKVAFRIHKLTETALLQPASVTIYEHHSPQERCVKFYHPMKKDGTLNILCSGQCECAGEKCSIQKKQNIQAGERQMKACDRSVDYVYKVKVIQKEYGQNTNTDIYKMKIEEILKTDSVKTDQQGSFMGHSTCRESFGFEEGKTYLIMGRTTDVLRTSDRMYYILAEQTWIEYWPTLEESETPQHKERFTGLRELTQHLMTIGCS